MAEKFGTNTCGARPGCTSQVADMTGPIHIAVLAAILSITARNVSPF
jgi:hypothetical protein